MFPIVKHSSRQPGQTLIETVAAIFILVTGVTSVLSLAIYALDSSSNISKQIIGTGLAREGVEAVKNMRDSNWLKGPLTQNGCYDYTSNPVGQNTANCYRHWLDAYANFNINPGNITTSYRLNFDPVNVWHLQSATNNFALDFDSAVTTSGFSGFYTVRSGSSGTADPAGTYYYRKITITPDTSGYFSEPYVGPRLLVASQVWWTGKNCPPSADWPGAGKCSVELDTNLTNWKDY